MNKEISLSAKDRETRMKLCKVLYMLFIISAFLLGYSGYNQIRFGIHSAKWPTIDGEIIKSQVILIQVLSEEEPIRQKFILFM
ncbi:MAG: hypothetical protein ACMUJM_20700 [bacterium]